MPTDTASPAKANQPAWGLDVYTFARLTNDAYSDYPGGVDPAGGAREGGNGPNDRNNIEQRMKQSGFRPLRDIPGHGESANGYFARAWINDATKPPTIIVANRGTNAGPDFMADGQFVTSAHPGKTAAAQVAVGVATSGVFIPKGGLHNQFKESIQALGDLVKEYPDAKIVTAGHSLGGGLSQLQAKVFPNNVVAAYNFDPPGADAVSRRPDFVAFARQHNPSYDPNGKVGDVRNWVVNETKVGDTTVTGPHIGGTQGPKIHTDQVVGRKASLGEAAIGAAGKAAGFGPVGAIAGAADIIDVAKHELTAKHPASSIVQALGRPEVDGALGKWTVLNGLQRPAPQPEQRKQPTQGEIEMAERQRRGMEAGRLHDLWMNGEGPSRQVLAGKTLSPAFDPNFAGMSAAFGRTEGTVVGTVGGRQDGYLVVRTGEHDFAYAPQSALAAVPRPGQHVRLDKDPVSDRVSVTPLREEPAPLREARLRESSSRLMQAERDAHEPAQQFLRERLGFDGSSAARTAELETARRGTHVEGVVVGRTSGGAVILQSGEKSFTTVPGEAFGKITPLAGKYAKFDIDEDGRARNFVYDPSRAQALVKDGNQFEAESLAAKQAFKDARSQAKSALAAQGGANALVNSVYGGEKVQGKVQQGPNGVVLIQTGQGALATYTAVPASAFADGKVPEPGQDVKLMIAPDLSKAIELGRPRELADAGRGR